MPQQQQREPRTACRTQRTPTGYGLNDGHDDGHDGTNAAVALITAAAVILCASGLLGVTAMDTIIIAMLAAVMAFMLHASRDRTYGM